MRINSVGYGAPRRQNLNTKNSHNPSFLKNKGVQLSPDSTARFAQLGFICGCASMLPFGEKIKDINFAKSMGYIVGIMAAGIIGSFAAVGIAKGIKGAVVNMVENEKKY